MSSSRSVVSAQPLQSVTLPLQVGNTLQRPASPPNGFMRINSQTNYLEIYYNNNWTPTAPVFGPLITASWSGPQVIYSGNFVTLIYTASGTFTVTNAPVGTTINYLVVGAGGGAGGYIGGGGGAGGLLTGTTFIPGGFSYAITVGAGGTGGTGGLSGSSGGSSSIGTVVTSIGGGYGAGSLIVGGNGGSGGGAGGNGSGTLGGVGVYPNSTFINSTRQGYDGGAAFSQSGVGPAGGGGGAGGAGANAATNTGGNGGVGLQNSLSGVNTYYAGGGGGALIAQTPGTGGLGGGGNATNGGGNGSSATINTGGGGGGGGSAPSTSVGGSGGSGIVIISYRFQ